MRKTLCTATDGWQPIKTAPKDGRAVDLWIPKMKGIPAYRSPDCRYVDGKWKLGDMFDLPWLQKATHWMPPPEPPAICAKLRGTK